MILQILAIIAGVAMLVFGGDGLVRGAVGIAARLRMPASLIGLTIVAMGTSMPELVVSIGAAVGGQPDLSIGNVVGSNIYNVGLILGITAMIRRLTCDLGDIRHDGAWMIGASALFIGVAWDGLLGRLDALAMLAVMGGFLWSAIRRNKAVAPPEPEADAPAPMGWPSAVGFVLGGLLLLAGGAQALIFGATAVAAALGVPEMIIGLTVVAIGTSLPELFASVMAAIRGESGIAISNVVGSNVFNLLFILGGTGTIHPIRVNPQVLQSDAWWMIGFAVLLVLWAGRALPVGRPFAAGLLALSAAYTYTLV